MTVTRISQDTKDRGINLDAFQAIFAELVALRAALGASSSTGAGGTLSGSAVYDAASLADGVGATSTITVTGAALGDFVVGISCSLDLQGITLTGYVSAADTVSFRLQNETAGTIDLASATFRAYVVPKAAATATLAAMNLQLI